MTVEQITEEFLVEMFRAVGLDHSIEEIMEYAKQEGWYYLHSWTEEQQDQFTAYMDDRLKTKTNWTKRARQREIGMFLLMYGWRTTHDA